VRLLARVPATSANLGPGFDCFALALDLVNEVEIQTGATGVSWEAEGAGELPQDGSDLVSRAMRRVEERSSATLPPVRLHGRNRIPLASGLGSSAAAAVAGAALASAILGSGASIDPEELIADAAGLEGHPDNAAAACLGGFTLAMPGGRVHRLDVHPGVRPVVLLPTALRLPTEQARRALPQTVPIGDAVFNAAHAALLVRALTHDPSLLGEAMRDRLHEERRLALVPAAGVLVERLRAASIPVCVSGAGPTLLAFEPGDGALPDPGEGWRALRLPVRPRGVEVEVLEP
jgi:homoserine kinase